MLNRPVQGSVQKYRLSSDEVELMVEALLFALGRSLPHHVVVLVGEGLARLIGSVEGPAGAVLDDPVADVPYGMELDARRAKRLDEVYERRHLVHVLAHD